MKEKKTCCFFGHRKIEKTNVLKEKLYEVIENIIVFENTDTFLFGSRSEFDDLCRTTVSLLKEKYPHIKRIYVRAEYPYISDDYEKYLLNSYEETYFPKHILNAGRAVYIRRNYEMIDKSDICIFYYMPLTKSGTGIAYKYAETKKKIIVNVYEKSS